MTIRTRHWILAGGGCAFVVAALALVYGIWLRPTRVLIVNALPAQAADLALNNDCRSIRLRFVDMEEAHNFSRYNAVILFGRGLFLDEAQTADLEQAARRGIPVFTKEARHTPFCVNRNLSDEQQQALTAYLAHACQHNYRNALRYIRHATTPHRLGDQDYEPPIALPENLLYHREYGQYFEQPQQLTDYLRAKGLYHAEGRNLALVAGINFPSEGNRAHVDTLITRLTQAGFNVYPIAGTGKGREDLLRTLHPDAVVHLAVGRLSGDSLANWLSSEGIPVFVPFPLVQSHEQWLDENLPIGGGILTARVVIPEIDGGIYPMCIATQNETEGGWLRLQPEMDRVEALVAHVTGWMALRDKPNADKRIAICYFKKPGNDALIASGLEVVPSLYNFLKRLQAEGYNVGELPATVEAFGERLHTDGAVMGSYAKGAQEQFLNKAHPVWLSANQYEQWARETLAPGKYEEVTDRYGEAPGELLARGDSIAVACVQYGNVLLFPQPRPALGDDEFKLTHGAKVAPPHSYLAPYLYMKKGFRADAVIHFGTHGNLEFTPGKNVGLLPTDWAEALLADLPHLYYYTTGNVGEGIIAKRRTHGALVTYLTPPYAESGMRQRYATLLDDIHNALDNEPDTAFLQRIKQEAMQLGLHRDLGLDSLPGHTWSRADLERLDDFAEEIANEKTLGAYYTLGLPYDEAGLRETVLAVAADPLAYEMAKADRDAGRITTAQLQDTKFVTHHYLPVAKKRIALALAQPRQTVADDLLPALDYRDRLLQSTQHELDAMVAALSGGSIAPAPGGDPVLNPNVLPTGRNMYSINAESTPNERAWEDGKRLAEETLSRYQAKHGQYPHKVSYTFWAGEFIATEGATIAQVLWMLGVQPVRDGQGRVMDLQLVPSSELGRPRIDVVVQVSGQLRDIAASRLKMITEAVRLAAEADDDGFPNYVAEGTREQEAHLVEEGASPKQAREMSVMRVFGPVNSGYSTGIMPYTENSGSWEDESEIAQGYINNMGTLYGDDDHWGQHPQGLFAAALRQTDAVVQPRQSNTWGPISLDHVYEFTGGLSLAVKTLTGKEPDAYMADYRNRHGRKLQDAKEAIAVETRSTILNPTYIRQRMKGGAGTAEMFGKMFRNIFGWNVMRPSSLDPELYNDLYDLYVADKENLGLHDYFRSVNPAALQTITAVMMESARKGYWQATAEQLRTTAQLHAQVTKEKGAACTEFVCGNDKLDDYIAQQLDASTRQDFADAMQRVHSVGEVEGREVVLKKDRVTDSQSVSPSAVGGLAIGVVVLGVLLVIGLVKRKRRQTNL